MDPVKLNRSSLHKTIEERRTIRNPLTSDVSEAVILELLVLAGWAPYHAKKEPWRVILIQSEAEKEAYGTEVLAAYERIGLWDSYQAELVPKMKERTRAFYQESAFSLLIVREVFATEMEEVNSISAVGAFLQNFQLLAWEQGLGVLWASGPNLVEAEFNRQMNVPAGYRGMASLHIGKIDESKKLPTSRRSPIQEWVTHLK